MDEAAVSNQLLAVSNQQLAVRAMGAELVMSAFVDLYEHANDSIAAQDALMDFYRKVGLLCSGWELTDDEAWEIFDGIRTAEIDDRAKDAYLSALEVAVQNHHPQGLAALILGTIHAEQGMIVLRMHQQKQLEVGDV